MTHCNAQHLRKRFLTDYYLSIYLPMYAMMTAPPLNLDTTVLLALASDITHGTVRVRQQQQLHPALRRQIAEEATTTPLLPELLPLLRGHPLIACGAAAARFREIVAGLASPTERARAEALFARPVEGLEQLLLPVIVVPDFTALQDAQRTEVFAAVVDRLRADPLGRAVFVTGWATGAATVTCNKTVVRRISAAVARAGNGEAGPRMLVVGCARSLVGRPKTPAAARVDES